MFGTASGEVARDPAGVGPIVSAFGERPSGGGPAEAVAGRPLCWLHEAALELRVPHVVVRVNLQVDRELLALWELAGN